MSKDSFRFYSGQMEGLSVDTVTINIVCEKFPSKFEWTLLLLKVIDESKASSCRRYLQKYFICRSRHLTKCGLQNLGCLRI